MLNELDSSNSLAAIALSRKRDLSKGDNFHSYPDLFFTELIIAKQNPGMFFLVTECLQDKAMVTHIPSTNFENCTISQIMQPITEFTHTAALKRENGFQNMVKKQNKSNIVGL